MDLIARERFIHSVRSLVGEEVVKRISNEEIAKEDIKTAFLFGFLKIDVLSVFSHEKEPSSLGFLPKCP